MKQNLILIAFGVGLYAALTNLDRVLTVCSSILGVFMPLLVGGVLAFVLNVPMSVIERRLASLFLRRNHTPPKHLLRLLSIVLTLMSIVLMIALVVTMVIPSLVQSGQSIYTLGQKKIPEWIALLNTYHIDMAWLTDVTAELDLKNLFSDLSGNALGLLQSAVGVATTTFSVIGTAAISIVIALYLLMDKDILAVQSKKLLYAYVKKPAADKLISIAGLVSQKYSSFLSGQCIEAFILGGLIFLTFSIFRLPYASLVAVLTGVTSFIPYVGAFLSCFIGAVLILMVNPVQALLSIAVYQAAQFIENQFIYPKVVGTSVGLSAFWTLVAVLIGGNLFGVLGMIFFIPLTSVLYTLVRDNINQRLQSKKQEHQ